MTPLEARLASLAAHHRTTTYGDLARDLGIRMAVLTAQLEATMKEDAAAGEPFRAALVSGKLLSDRPALGFFVMAAELGRLSCAANEVEQAAFVAAQRAALFTAAR